MNAHKQEKKILPGLYSAWKGDDRSSLVTTPLVCLELEEDAEDWRFLLILLGGPLASSMKLFEP